MTDRILVFIPMYNCSRQIPRVISQFSPEIRGLFAEVLVVDNRSTDGGVDAALSALSNLTGLPGTVMVNDENYNLGGSHKVAFNYAIENGFDYVIVLHGDDQADVNDLVPHLRAGTHRAYDSFLGSRFMRGATLKGYSAFRTFGNRVFNIIFSIAAGRRLHDLGAGLNIYKTQYLRPRFYIDFPNALTFNNYLLLAGVAGRSKFAFFPLTWREEDQRSNVKMTRQALKTLGIVLGYFFGRARYLARDHSGRRGRAYTSTVVARVRDGRVSRTDRPVQAPSSS